MESKKKGKIWEKRVQSFFPPDLYIMQYYPGDFIDRYSVSNERPDYEFKDRKTGLKFFVECKYRSALSNDKINLVEGQLVRFREFAKLQPLYYALHLDLKDFRAGFYFFPIEIVEYSQLYYSRIKKYKRVGLSPLLPFELLRA